jgi:flagellar motility protein MotE (MotC chaperone)
VKGSSEYVDVAARSKLRKHIEEIQKKIDDPQYAKEAENLKKLKEDLAEQEKKLPVAEGKNTHENLLILLHSKMASDPEIEKLIASSKDRLKRPIP